MPAAISLEVVGARVYFRGDTFAHKETIRGLGGHWDKEARAWWVGKAKEEEARALVERLANQPAAVRPAKQDPADIRLTGKARYKGREYYAGSETRDGQRVRLLTLPDREGNYLDFWARVAEVETIKTYAPREIRGHLRYTTLGGIALFIREQQEARASGAPLCAACGKAGDLVEDGEDGMLKHRRCCDIPLD